MATKPGQQVVEKFGNVIAGALAVGLLNEIGDRHAEHIRLQNISQMSQGKNRNGLSMGKYKPATVAERKRLGLQTSKVTLYRTGGFQDRIKAHSTSSKVDKKAGTAVINWEIVVDKKDAGRLLGFRTGKYGKNGRNIPRPVIGMADKGTNLRTAQEKQLRRIAAQVYKSELGGDMTFDTKDT
jgi:hypothetical protein